jgi:hypothetical protein
VGLYAVKGQLVALNDLKPSAAEAGALPAKMELKLAWTGPDTFVASNEGQALYMRRHTPGNPIVRLMQMGLKPGKAEAPGAMRGVIATMQNNVNRSLDSDQ